MSNSTLRLPSHPHPHHNPHSDQHGQQQQDDEDDFLFTHIPPDSLDFVDILNLAEPEASAQSQPGPASLPIPSEAHNQYLDLDLDSNRNSNSNPNSNPSMSPLTSTLTSTSKAASTAPSLTWSAGSPESTTGSTQGHVADQFGFGGAYGGVGGVSPQFLVQQFQNQQQQQQQQHQYQQQQQQQHQYQQQHFRFIQQQQQGVDPLQSTGFDAFGLDGFGYGYDQAFGHAPGQDQVQGMAPGPNSGEMAGMTFGAGNGMGVDAGYLGRMQGSFEGTLGFGMGGPGIGVDHNSDLDYNLGDSGDVLGEQELKRLLSMGDGSALGFGGTVDWVGLLQGGTTLDQVQGQGQTLAQGQERGILGVKRESIDDAGSTTSTAKGTASVVEAGDLAPALGTTAATATATSAVPPAPASNPNRSPRQQQSKQPGINLHNKVEKRYRSNVKNALDSLRDAVPRLRQVYGTSLPSELETTDRQGEDGLMGGIGEIGKPTKQTIMLGARMYIEYLEMKGQAGEAKRERSDRVLMRLLGADSQEKWARWEQEQDRAASLAEEEYRQGLERKNIERALMLAPPGGSTSGGSPSSSSPPDGADEDEEEEAPPVRGRPKKRPREADDESEDKKPVKKRPTAKMPKKAGGKKATTVETVTGASAAVMYSFGLAYTFFPRASSVFRSTARQEQETQGSASAGSVILSAPYRAANHSTHLLKRALPERHHDFWVLKPDDFLDWVGLFFLASVLSWITWRLAKSVGLISTGISTGVEEEQAEDAHEAAVDILTESTYRGRIGTIVEGLKMVGSKIGRRTSDEVPTVEKAWLRITKSFVGKSLDLDVWTQTRVRWRMARKAAEDPQYATLQALYTQDPLHWQHARRIALDTTDKQIQDVLALPSTETRALSKRLGPSEDPVRTIAEYLVITHLDDLATRLYISLVDASISSEVGVNSGLMSLADVSYKEQIFEALHGVSRESPAYSLGLVLIGLWGMLSRQNASAQRSVANMLIASQLKDRVDLPSIDVLLGLVVPAYRPSKRDMASDHQVGRLPLGVAELDTLLEVCLRYVSLVKRLESRDPASRRGVYSETLRIRQLLGRPTFERTFRDISGYRLRTGSSSSDASASDTESIASSEEGSISAIEAEVEAFDVQTDKLIDSLVDLGHRAVRSAPMA